MGQILESKTKIIKDNLMEGVARISGTRIRVSDIATRYNSGMSPEEISEDFSGSDIDLADVYAAISYYLHHKKEIDAEIRNREEFFKKYD